MKAEIKQRWLDALRGGEYRQGKEALNGPNGFCCLGVLCDLYVKDGQGEWEGKEDLGKHIGYCVCYPPISVMEWAGLPVRLGEDQDVILGSDKATNLNDTGHTFADIADAIEREVPSE